MAFDFRCKGLKLYAFKDFMAIDLSPKADTSQIAS